MSKFDFDKITDRRGTASLKWDVKDNELPMWVADMDFEVCPDIVKAVSDRLSKPALGYNIIDDEWYDAYIGWWKSRHGLTMERDALIFSTGVVPSLSSIVRRLTRPAENVLIQTPVYNMFFNSIVNNGRNIAKNPLIYRDGAYSVDFEDLEKKLSDPQTTLFILCNPHNPVGKIWDAETLKRMGELCVKHGVTVVADEIHCDLTAPDKGYIPFASVSDECKYNSVTCIAPTKAFNIAGLQTSALYIPEPKLRHAVWRGLNNDEIAEPNSFAVPVTVAAFNKGGAWLDGMRKYVFDNRKFVGEFLSRELPSVKLVDGDATYLLWVDCGSVTDDTEKLCDFIRAYNGLYITHGGEYGENGRSFVRINVATQRARVLDGMKRFKDGVQAFIKDRK